MAGGPTEEGLGEGDGEGAFAGFGDGAGAEETGGVDVLGACDGGWLEGAEVGGAALVAVGGAFVEGGELVEGVEEGTEEGGGAPGAPGGGGPPAFSPSSP